MYELVYTSAQRGLRPGASGFCTVAHTQGMPAQLISKLEQLSTYKHRYIPPDPNSFLNPVKFTHVTLTSQGERWYVLSRIADAGVDFSGRSNLIAHHFALASHEARQLSSGPGSIAARKDLFVTEWNAEPRLLAPSRGVHDVVSANSALESWKELAGDPGWAGLLAGVAQHNADFNVYVVLCETHRSHILKLFTEATMLLPETLRWRATFSTYFTRLNAPVDCRWRAVFSGSPEAEDIQDRTPDRAIVIDLSRPSAAPSDHPLFGSAIRSAREGRSLGEQVSVSRVAPSGLAPFNSDDEAWTLLATEAYPAVDVLSPMQSAIQRKLNTVTSPPPPPSPRETHLQSSNFPESQARRKRQFRLIIALSTLLLLALTGWAWSSIRDRPGNNPVVPKRSGMRTAHVVPKNPTGTKSEVAATSKGAAAHVASQTPVTAQDNGQPENDSRLTDPSRDGGDELQGTPSSNASHTPAPDNLIHPEPNNWLIHTVAEPAAGPYQHAIPMEPNAEEFVCNWIFAKKGFESDPQSNARVIRSGNLLADDQSLYAAEIRILPNTGRGHKMLQIQADNGLRGSICFIDVNNHDTSVSRLAVYLQPQLPDVTKGQLKIFVGDNVFEDFTILLHDMPDIEGISVTGDVATAILASVNAEQILDTELRRKNELEEHFALLAPADKSSEEGLRLRAEIRKWTDAIIFCDGQLETLGLHGDWAISAKFSVSQQPFDDSIGIDRDLTWAIGNHALRTLDVAEKQLADLHKMLHARDYLIDGPHLRQRPFMDGIKRGFNAFKKKTFSGVLRGSVIYDQQLLLIDVASLDVSFTVAGPKD